jgi:lyso-ornithine lipid O-acyltransferase
VTRLSLKVIRVLLLLTVTVLFSLPAIANLLLFHKRTSGTRHAALLMMLWSRASCRILGIEVSVTGGACGGFTASNHVSYVDILVLGSLNPSVFVSKLEVMSWPVLGWLARLGATVFVNRNSRRGSVKALDKAEAVLDSGVSLVVFPEGTSSDGSAVGSFRGMFFDIPARKAAPVIPVSIMYAEAKDAYGTYPVAWYTDMSLLPHLWELLGRKGIKAFVHVSPPIQYPEAVRTSDARKRLSLSSRESIESGLRRLALTYPDTAARRGFRYLPT